MFEGFEITGGTFTCVFSESHDLTVRDNVIHDCPSHGVLAADQNSGALTFEFNEVYRSGSGTSRHSMYIQSDEVAYPDTVFRMRFNYVHDGNGGILMRTRHQRSEIYYNWFERSTNEEVEFVGPDCHTQKSGWTPDLRREDTDFVGNVIVHTSTWRDAIRAGGDLDGRSQGRVRLVNNTIVFDRPGLAVGVRVLLGVESLEMHNNVLYQTTSGAPMIVEEVTDPATPFCAPFGLEPWVNGRKVYGSSNWVETGSSAVPIEWTSVYSGADPVLANIAQRMLRPLAISPLARAANQTPPTAPAFPFPSPLLVPLYDPPLRAKLDPGQEDFRKPVVDRLDVGALQVRDIDEFVDPIPMNGSPPLIPPKRSSFNSPGASSGSTHAGTPAGIQSALRAASRVSGLAVRRCARVPSSQRSVLWSWAISPQSAFRVLVAMARCAAALR
ncbi:MAG: right-handed parallel beta-helix repeat-containing protein [Pseudomonadota bacterium]|nr:right-handed parallel beta-helix repeat-containing protein [Pseudomonadota bacterium]